MMSTDTVQCDFEAEDAENDAFNLMRHDGKILIWVETDGGEALFTREQFETMVKKARKLMEWK